MKKLLAILFALVLVFGVVGMANSALWDRGGGLIYDDVLDVTWLQDANYAQTSGYDVSGSLPWVEAVAWADSLVYAGYSDWRLPKALPVNPPNYDYNFSYDGSTDRGYNITSPNNEMSHSYRPIQKRNMISARLGSESVHGGRNIF